MIEQRKNKYEDCKIWVKQVYFVLCVIVDSRKVCGSMTLWKIFRMRFISCSSLSLWTVQFWARGLSPQDRGGRFIHLERTGSERCISIKIAEGRRVGVSWRKKINYEIKRWERCRQFHLLLQAHRIRRRDNTERHIIEACTARLYLEELKSTQPKISPALYSSVCPRGWCCKSDTSLGFDMVLDLTRFTELSIQ